MSLCTILTINIINNLTRIVSGPDGEWTVHDLGRPAVFQSLPVLPQDSSYPCHWRPFLFHVCKGTHQDQEKLRPTRHCHFFSFNHGYWSRFGIDSGSFGGNISLVSWSEVDLGNNSIFHFFTLRKKILWVTYVLIVLLIVKGV